MPLAVSYPKMSREEYLEWEEQQLDKHEYVAGEIFCHAGARKEHNVVAGNLFAELRTALKGRSCQAYISDMRLQINAADAYVYPDVLVTCSDLDTASDLYIEHPSFIAEVLSDSTSAWDQEGKFHLYQLIPELQEYMILDPLHRSIKLYRKSDTGSWLLTESANSDEIRIESLGVTILRSEILPEDKRK